MPPPPVTTESYVYCSRSISADGGASDGSLQSLSGYNQTGDFAAAYLQDPDALQPCGSSDVQAVVLPSASSSSTLNSMGGLSPASWPARVPPHRPCSRTCA